MNSGGTAILLALTAARLCVAFQFQSLSMLAPLLRERFVFGEAGYGLLLGLYMAPGLPIAFAGPAMLRRFGTLALLAGALAVMAAGQACLAVAATLPQAAAARVLAGLGGCVMYVLAIDVAARFCGAAGSPARMGVVAGSWPMGNALAPVVLGALAAAGYGQAALWLPALACGLALAWLLPAAARSGLAGAGAGAGTGTKAEASARGRWRRAVRDWGQALRGSAVAGASFGLYNAGFIVWVSFTPAILAERGYGPAEAARVASLPMWVFCLSVPLGGLLMTRWRRGGLAMVLLGCGGAVLGMLLSLHAVPAAWYAVAGLAGGLPTAPMLARARAVHPGLAYPALFAIFFAILLVLPPLVGAAIAATGSAANAVAFCIALQAAAVLVFAGYRDRPA